MSEPIDRRRLLTGLGAAVAVGGAMTITGGASAEAAALPAAAPAPGSNASGRPRLVPAVLPHFAPTPGLRYAGLTGYALKTGIPSSAVMDVSGVGAGPRPLGGYVTVDVDLPNGAVIKELHVWGSGGVAATLQMQSFGTYALSPIGTATAAFGTGLQYGTTAIADVPVNRDLQTALWFMSLLAADAVDSLLVGYEPTLRSFVPIAPARVYDTRFVPPVGKLAAGANVTISVADGYAAGSGVVSMPGVVPPGAAAIAYNVTVTHPTGTGYVSVNPGGTSSVAASSVNFVANQTVANGLTVALDDSRQITIFCVGASTDVIIDVQGYYI